MLRIALIINQCRQKKIIRRRQETANELLQYQNISKNYEKRLVYYGSRSTCDILYAPSIGSHKMMQATEIKITISYQKTCVDVTGTNTATDETAFLPAGIELRDALINYVTINHRASLSKKAAQNAIQWVNSCRSTDTHYLKVRTRNLFHGNLDWLELSNHDIQKAIDPTIDRIVRNITYKVQYHVAASKSDDFQLILQGDLVHLNALISKLETSIGKKLRLVEVAA